MADIAPFRGIRFNPEHVKLGGVLAPPYDVITDEAREALYGRNLRNIVRIDYGARYDDDVPGVNDAYTRADGFLHTWLDLEILVREEAPSLYVSDHEFVHPSGEVVRRRGVFATVAARRWRDAPVRPHERTLAAPKEDRLALLRATAVQSSPVFALWRGGAIPELIDDTATGDALLGGRTDGELGSEKHRLWRVDDPSRVASLVDAMRSATLYVADGHHRYETAVAYAEERHLRDPRCLVYLASAGDPALVILPTHRLVRPGPTAFSLDDLWARLDDSWDVEPVADVLEADRVAAAMRVSDHAFVVAARDGAAVLHRPRHEHATPRERLDASVLETDVLRPAGVSADAIAAGALAYTRDLHALEVSVRSGAAMLGFGLQPTTVDEVLAVADAGESMPQKSTYFYPKVPTGMVLLPTWTDAQGD